MTTKKEKVVHCRYPKCLKLHSTTELKESEAIKGGSRSYYHPDCYHMMQTVNKIKDTFYKEINPAMTGQQIGQLVSIVNNMVLVKGIDVDFILFGLRWYIDHRPGKLRYPGGISYVTQNKDVIEAWDREKQRKLREEIREQQKNIVVNDEFKLDFPDTVTNTNNNKRSKFSSVLGV